MYYAGAVGGGWDGINAGAGIVSSSNDFESEIICITVVSPLVRNAPLPFNRRCFFFGVQVQGGLGI